MLDECFLKPLLEYYRNVLCDVTRFVRGFKLLKVYHDFRERFLDHNVQHSLIVTYLYGKLLGKKFLNHRELNIFVLRTF